MIAFMPAAPSQAAVDQHAPPSADQVKAYLDKFPPRPPSRALVWTGLIAMGIALMLTFSQTGGLLPFFGLMLAGAVFVALMIRAWWLRELERRVGYAVEVGVWRDYPRSLRTAWLLLPRVTTVPQLHGRVVALIADSLDHQSAWDSAIVAYDMMLHHLPGDHPAAIQLRVRRATAQLFGDQLADADDELRKLRGVIDRFAGSVIAAGYRFAQLAQHVLTHHDDDAVAMADALLDDLRPLGIDAAFGHALLALSYQRLESRTQEPEAIEQSGRWWGHATLLLPVDVLVYRLDMLRPLAEDGRLKPYTESPWPPTPAAAGPHVAASSHAVPVHQQPPPVN